MGKRIDRELIKRMLERRPDLSGVLAERRQAVVEMANMLIVLTSDIREPKVGSEEFHERRHRRAFVRAVFAFIEGMTYAFKMDALANSRVFGPNFTEAETLFLGGETLELNDKGEEIAKPGALIPLKKIYGSRLPPAREPIIPTSDWTSAAPAGALSAKPSTSEAASLTPSLRPIVKSRTTK